MTASRGCQSRTSRPSASQSGRPWRAATIPKGRALAVIVSPVATPILRSPKSKASTPAGVPGARASGMTRVTRDAAQVDAQEFRGGVPARLERQVEDDALVG